VLLCNLSEPEVEEASPADSEELCLVTAESDDTTSAVAENNAGEVECCTEVSSVDCKTSSPLHNDNCVSQQTSTSSVLPVRTSDRKKRSVSRSVGVALRKKQKVQ